MSTLIVDDASYEMTREYREGAEAARASIPWSCNPHRDRSARHEQWSLGHCNEYAGVHVVDGVDVITYRGPSRIFRTIELVFSAQAA